MNNAQLFENAVINQLSNYGDISFYHKKTAEIDAILDKEFAFEIKLTGTPSDYKKLIKTASSINLKKLYLISKNFKPDKNFLNAVNL